MSSGVLLTLYSEEKQSIYAGKYYSIIICPPVNRLYFDHEFAFINRTFFRFKNILLFDWKMVDLMVEKWSIFSGENIRFLVGKTFDFRSLKSNENRTDFCRSASCLKTSWQSPYIGLPNTVSGKSIQPKHVRQAWNYIFHGIWKLLWLVIMLKTIYIFPPPSHLRGRSGNLPRCPQ